MARIIVAGSDGLRRRDLRTALECEGHAVREVETVSDAEVEACIGNGDLLIVDAELDGGDVFSLCRAVRADSNLGIIAIIPAGCEQARIDALNSGADDYVHEQFIVGELLARVRAILRRVRAITEVRESVRLEDRTIDLRSRKVEGPGNRIASLTPREFLVLERLISGNGATVTNRHLAQTVWQRDGAGDLEYVRIVIGQLRRKLEPDHNSPRYILTERAIGYRFRTLAPGVSSPRRNPPAPGYKIGSPAMAQ